MKTLRKMFTFCLLAVFLMACNTKTGETGGPSNGKAKVVVETANEILYRDKIYATGRVAFENEYKLSFKTAGIIETIAVKEGGKVEQGQLLASLKLDEITAKTGQAENAVAKAERDFGRATALYADSVATLEQLQNAESQLKHAKLDLETAQFNLRYSQIRAPQNGVIQYVNAKENEAVQAGSPVLLFGSQSSSKILKTALSDADVVKIARGDSAFVLFDPFPETIFQGTVDEISGTADPSTGTYEVKVEIADSGNLLKSGFIGTATIHASNTVKYIELPVESLVVADGKSGEVYVTKNGVAQKRTIEIYQIVGEKLLVSKGINAGEKVIVGGLQNLSKETEQVEF